MQEYDSGASKIWHVLSQSTVLRNLAAAAAHTCDAQEGDVHLSGALAPASPHLACLQQHRLATVAKQALRRTSGILLPVRIFS